MSVEKPLKVIVGLSGGVDSSVAAFLLQQQGYEVEGLFMKNWEEDDTDTYCAAADDLADAQAVCECLSIPLHTINFATEYWDNVFEHFLAEYKAGRTPNPDILCNKEIKFKAFLDFALEELHADFIATGHYVRRSESEQPKMFKGVDGSKDQSYFLYTLSHEQLAKSLFPLGELQKDVVREIALKQGLVTAKKKDSTGICFIGERRFSDFLATYLPAQKGVIETTQGDVLGEHQGLMFHTLGQRKGLGIGGLAHTDGEPWYVVDKDLERNVLIVAQGLDNPRLFSASMDVKQLHWVSGHSPEKTWPCSVKVRYRQVDVPCMCHVLDEQTVRVVFEQPVSAVTPGQSAVFYKQDECLGGGIIETRYP